MCCAGENSLPGKYDIVKVELQPSEQYKSVSHINVNRSKKPRLLSCDGIAKHKLVNGSTLLFLWRTHSYTCRLNLYYISGKAIVHIHVQQEL